MILNTQAESNSSTVKRCFYDFTTKVLKVEFVSGAIYEYEGVPSIVYDDLCKADSQGKYFTESIKNNYSYNKLLLG
jgi:hypothetical protein